MAFMVFFVRSCYIPFVHPFLSLKAFVRFFPHALSCRNGVTLILFLVFSSLIPPSFRLKVDV